MSNKQLRSFTSHSAPFVMKMRFYLPQGVNCHKNAAHAKYITDKAVPSTDNNVLNEPSVHAQYMGQRHGNTGLFGSNENENIKDLQKELRKHDGVVWRVILSLREDDAKKLGHNSKEDWERIVRLSAPEAAKQMGIKEPNLRWAAAFHNEPGHPHVHLMIWEKEPRILRGKLDDTERKNVRRVFMNEFYGDERRRLMLERTELRDSMREAAIFQMGIRPRKNRTSAENERPMEAAPQGRLSESRHSELTAMLTNLRSLLPGKGRLSLAFMPRETKEAARSISNWLMEQDGFREIRDQYLERVRALTMHHTFNEDSIRDAEQRALDDLRDRVAQVVLRGAVETQSDVSTRDFVLESLSASHAAWAAAFAATYIRQFEGRTDAAQESKEALIKSMGEEAYRRWKLRGGNYGR